MRYWLRCLILFPLLAWAKNDTPTQLAKQALALYEVKLDRAVELASLGLKEAQQQTDRPGEAWCHLALGTVQRQKGDLETAFNSLMTAQRQFDQLNAPLEAAHALREAGGARSQAFGFAEAEKLLRASLAILRRLAPGSSALAESYRELGLNCLRSQSFGQSLALLDSARQIFLANRDTRGLAKVQNNLGLCYRNMDDLENALRAYLSALDAFEVEGQPSRPMAALLINLANLNLQLGDTTAQSVDSLYRRAFRIGEVLRDTSQLVGMSYSLTSYLITRKRYEEARQYIGRAQDLAQRAGLRVEQANLTTQWGISYSRERKDFEAITVLDRAVQQYREAGSPYLAITPLGELSHLHQLRGNYQRAIEVGQAALAIKQLQPNFRFTAPRIRYHLAACYLASGQVVQARKMGLELLQEGRESNRRTTVLMAYGFLQRLDSAVGNVPGELGWLKQYQSLRDSILTVEKAQILQSLSTSHAIKQMQQLNELQAVKISNRNTYLWGGGILVLMLFVGLGLLNHLASQRRLTNQVLAKNNEEISQQYEEITRQNEVLATKNQALEALDKEKTNLLRIITHDLRAPLGNITAIAELALGETSVPRDHVDMIRHIADDALETVAQLLNWQTVNQPEINANSEPLNITCMLGTVVDRFAIEASQKQISLHLPPSPDGASWALGDRNFVRKILENLISNALKFSPTGKNVYLTLKEGASQLAIGVRDEGPGIPPEDLPKLFGQFQQLSARPTGGEASSGLGLYIAKRYAETMGGDITCHSVPGNGATFTVQLPIGPTTPPLSSGIGPMKP